MLADIIKACEVEIEQILASLEQKGRLGEAFAAYRGIESKMAKLGMKPSEAGFRGIQRVLAFCLMRQANLLRQMGQLDEAKAVSERELVAARASGDNITLARSLMSQGTTKIASGEVDDGLHMIEEARLLFEKGASYEHKQGLGWYWILQADLLNAGLLPKEPMKVIEAANQAIAILEPIENWPGVARAYEARAIAHEALGNTQSAADDCEAKTKYEKFTSSSEDY